MTSDTGQPPDPGRLGERRYRFLLLALPRRARDELDEELLELFRHHRNERLTRRGGLGPAFWWFVLRDTWSTASAERREPLDFRGRPPVAAPERGGEGMRDLIDDLSYSARRLVRSPGFTAAAITILMLTIGVNTAAFSVVNALLLQPPPFEAPDRIVDVMQHTDGGDPASASYPAYRDMIAIEGVFESVSASYTDLAFVERDEALAPILIEYASASYLDVIGLAASRGAWFDETHDDPNGPPAAVLTFGMWADRFGADPGVIGRTLQVNGGSATVVGVGPPEFNGGRGPAAVDLWLSISALRRTGGRFASLTRRQDHPFGVRARLADGVSVSQATAAMDRLAADLARDYPEFNANRGITVFSVLDNRVSPEADAEMRRGAMLAMSVVLLVLLIGALNLANLMLVRGNARSSELAVRLALGAGRGRIMRTVLVEAFLLVVLGGLGGLALAAVMAELTRNARIDVLMPLLVDLRLDRRVIAYTALLTLGAGVLVGVVPGIRASKRGVVAALRDTGNEIGARRRMGLTGTLVAGQVALSLLLLAVSGVFVESLVRASGANPGFSPEGMGYVQVNAGPLELEADAVVQTYDMIEDRLAGLGAVEGVARAVRLPAAQFGTTTLLLGAQVDGVDRPSEIAWNLVTPNYFEVLGIPILHGRVPERGDPGARETALVSEAFAMTYWGRTDIVGERYRSESNPERPVEIVGVVADATVRALGEPPTPSLYWPFEAGTDVMHFVLRTNGSMTEALTAASAVVREVDDRILVTRVGTLEEHLGDTLGRQRMIGALLSGLGILALVLAMLGVYGVVAYSVARRRHEIGIRIALGAARDRVVRFFVRDVSLVVVVGAGLGMLMAVPSSALVGRVFTGGEAGPVAAIGAAFVLIATSLVATVIPAVRASRTDPTDALRRE